jgi:hypothetical protein
MVPVVAVAGAAALAGKAASWASTVSGWFTGGPKSEQVEADRLGNAGWKSLDDLPERGQLEPAIKSAVGIDWRADRKNRLWVHPDLYGVIAVKIGSTSAGEWQSSKLTTLMGYPGVSGEDWILIVAPVGDKWKPVTAIVDFKGSAAELSSIRAACQAAGWSPPAGGLVGGALSSATGGLGIMAAIARLFGVR